MVLAHSERLLECTDSTHTAAQPADLQILSHDEFLALRKDARVVEHDGHGEKVLMLADGNYLKLFRRKRFFSSAAWRPYAQRFADNAQALAARAIPCPRVIAVFRIPAIQRDGVRYQALAGETLRELLRRNCAPDDLRERLGEFVAQLHARGIYFRSLHLGNIVLTAENQLGLIDFADMKIHRGPLGPRHRQRNLQHLLRDAAERAWLCPEADERFTRAYRRARI